MQGKCLRRKLRACFSVKGGQRLFPVQHGLVRFLAEQMQVQFLHLPGAVSLVRIRGLHRVRGQRKAFLRRVGRHLMLRMAVFPVLRVGHHHFRFETAVQFVDPVQDLLLSARVLVGVFNLAGFGVSVIEIAEHGIVADSHGPQPVQCFAAPGGIAGGQVSHFNPVSFFCSVGRDRSSGKQQFVVRMGNQEQDVRLFHGFFPALYPVRNLSLAESKDLVEAQGVLLFHGGPDPDLLLTVQFKEGVVIPGIPSLRHRDPAVAVRLFNHIGIRQFPEAQVQPVDRFVGGDGHPGFFPAAAFPERRILPVRNAAGLAGFIHNLHSQPGRQVLRFLRHGGHSQNQQDQQDGKQDLQLVHVSNPCLSV